LAASFIAAFFKISLGLASISSSFGIGLFPSPVAYMDFRSGLCRIMIPAMSARARYWTLDKSVAMAAARLDGRQGMERTTHRVAREVTLPQWWAFFLGRL
jgi:hypothetical protein